MILVTSPGATFEEPLGYAISSLEKLRRQLELPTGPIFSTLEALCCSLGDALALVDDDIWFGGETENHMISDIEFSAPSQIYHDVFKPAIDYY